MNRAAACLVISFFVLLVSCQREIEFEIPDVILLAKTVDKTPRDSVVTNFTYDAKGRLTLYNVSGMQAGTDMGEEIKIYRQSTGVITKTTEKAAYLQIAGVDSITTTFSYNAGTSQYPNAMTITIYPGIVIRDSIVYDYDTSGRITRDYHYQKITGVPFLVESKREYIYDVSGNIDTVRNFNFDFNLGMLVLNTIMNYDYDAKTNPLIMGKEATLLYLYPFCGPNNTKSVNVTYPSTPSMNYFENKTYIYNSKDHPGSATIGRSSGGVSSITYYYKTL